MASAWGDLTSSPGVAHRRVAMVRMVHVEAWGIGLFVVIMSSSQSLISFKVKAKSRTYACSRTCVHMQAAKMAAATTTMGLTPREKKVQFHRC